MDNSSEPVIERARRATLEDLPALQALWQRAGLPWNDLDKYFTEFQVVPGDEGTLRGALGLQVDGTEGLIHSEALFSEEDADQVRSALWTRVLIVARNQGVARLWTLEDADFWRTFFVAAKPEQRAEFKAAFADPQAAWLTYPLVDAARAQQLVNEQMALWEASRASDAQGLSAQLDRVRGFAYLFAATVVVVMLAMVGYVLVRRPDIIQRLLHRGH